MKRCSHGLFVFFILGALTSQANAALDSTCQPYIKAIQSRILSNAWAETAVPGPGGLTVKTIRINGHSYRQVQGDAWMKMPMDLNQAELEKIELIKKGKILVSHCSFAGETNFEGVQARVFHYSIKMPGADTMQGKLYIGVNNSLPYFQETSDLKIRYQYTNIQPPK